LAVAERVNGVGCPVFLKGNDRVEGMGAAARLRVGAAGRGVLGAPACEW